MKKFKNIIVDSKYVHSVNKNEVRITEIEDEEVVYFCDLFLGSRIVNYDRH